MYTHMHRCTHTMAWSYSTLQVYNYGYGTFMNICTNICRHNISKLKCEATLFVAFFSCLVCGRLQDLCTLRGVSQPRTLPTLLPSQHTHTHTITHHTHMHRRTHTYSTLQVYNYRYGTFMNICTNICRHNISKLKCGATLFFCLVCGCLKKNGGNKYEKQFQKL